ncbi:hypothetical protein, partial [Bifidobacterium apri]|uniref:hypothetical protein n=1 Tax=Bifidobacterium apri TaxID=1769423 RepID=UPI00197AC231
MRRRRETTTANTTPPATASTTPPAAGTTQPGTPDHREEDFDDEPAGTHPASSSALSAVAVAEYCMQSLPPSLRHSSTF